MIDASVVGNRAIQSLGEQVGELAAHLAVKDALVTEQTKIIGAQSEEIATLQASIQEYLVAFEQVSAADPISLPEASSE